MYAISYEIIFAFHPGLNIDRIIIGRNFGHLTEKLTSFNYLTREQLLFKNCTTPLQLRECAINVTPKNNPLAISEMLSTEVEFACGSLLRWFNKKLKTTA